MSNQIFEDNVAPHRGHAAGDTDVEKAASQLASDVKYKVRKSMSGSTHLSPAQVSRAYVAQLSKSPAPPAVKTLAKKKLVSDSYIHDVDDLVSETISSVLNKVFVEGVEKVEENIPEINEEIEDKKYKIRVTDKETGNSYVTRATRAKISELRANPNISSVEMTGYGEPIRSEREKGEQTASVKAGKGVKNPGAGEKYEKKYGKGGKNTVGDKDGDGTKEPDRHEYAGVKDTAIKKAKGVKEEFLGEVKKKDEKDKIKETGVNNYKDGSIKLFPEIKEQSANISSQMATTDASEVSLNDKTKRVAKQQNDRMRQKEIQIVKTKLAGLMAAPKGSDPSINASYEPEGDNIQEVSPPGFEGTIKGMKKHPELSQGKTKEGKDKNIYALAWWMKNKGYKSHKKPSGAMKEESECGTPKVKNSKEEDPREVPTKVTLVRNKLRAMGLKMSYEPDGNTLSERGPDRNALGGADRDNSPRYRDLGPPTPQQAQRNKQKEDSAAARAVAQLRRRRAAEEARKKGN